MAKQTIAEQIERVRRGRTLDDSTGLLYSSEKQRTARYNRIRLFGIFVSDEGTYLVRGHIFNSAELRTPREWDDYMREHYGEILPRILGGMADRTGKFWRLHRIIGWVPDVDSRTSNSKAPTPRNKTKRARR